MKIHNQREIWNKIAEKWSAYRRVQVKDLNDFLKDKKGNILDLGCGSGRNFIKLEGKIFAVDFSENMLMFAEKKMKELNIDVEFFCTSADNLPFIDNFFDSAIFVATLHCIETEEKRKKAIRELYRVLKNNAEVFITVWSKNQERIKKGGKEQLIPWGLENEKVMRYYYIFDKEELENILIKEGFEIKSSKEDDNIVIIARKGHK